MNQNHKVISCAGFGGTGSSAITDLLSEFDGFKGIGTFEFTIMHDVDGLLDLKHFLVDDFHRLKSTEALFRFERLVDNIANMYRPYLGDEFRIESNRYINAITDFQWSGYWHQHLYRQKKWVTRVKYKLPERIQKSVLKIVNRNSQYEYSPYYLKNDIKFCVNEEKFLVETKKYINNLINILDKENKYEYMVLDQLVSPYNIDNYFEFFDDLHVIVVDRDPRDLYLLNKLYWKEGWIPSHDVELFVEWFKSIRENKLSYGNKKVKYVYLEQLIFDYEKSVKEIINFLGIDESRHTEKLQKFNPERSKKNCKLWEREQGYEEDIKIIEEKLRKYCLVGI